MKKILLLIICITSLSVYAQQQGLDCKKTIGRVIENDEDYLYADKTAQNENTALADAKQTLRQVVSNYLISHQYDYSQGQLDMIMNNYPSICVIPRADKMRAFIYISIDDIKSVVKKVDLHKRRIKITTTLAGRGVEAYVAINIVTKTNI